MIPTASLYTWKSWSKVGWCNKFLPHLSPFNLGQYLHSLLVNAKVIKKSVLLLSTARNAVLPIQKEAISNFSGTPASFGNTPSVLRSGRISYSYCVFSNAIFVAVFLKLFIPFFFCLIIRLDNLEKILAQLSYNLEKTLKQPSDSSEKTLRQLRANFGATLRKLWQNCGGTLKPIGKNIATTLGPHGDC